MLEKLRNIIRQEKGFTLIELLVVIAIIGILAAIAIPQFAAYKRQANDGAAKSQVRNMAVSMEAFYVTNNDYGGGPEATEANLATFGYVADADVTVTLPSAVTPCAAPEVGGVNCFSMDAFHINGTAGAIGIFTWNSALGGAQF